MPAVILSDLITDSMIKNGLLAPGEDLEANYGAYATREANRLLDQWNIQANFVWTMDILLFTLTARPISTIVSPIQYWYTIGPAGSLPDLSNPDFVAPRPPRIIRANLLLQVSSPHSRVPLQLFDARQWSDETVPQLGTTIPTGLYDDYADPFSNLFVWPFPTVTQNQLELFVWNQIPRFTDISNTFEMPAGYEDAFMLTMAERLAEGIRPISDTLRQDAARARANVRSLNSQSPKISTADSGMPGMRKSLGNFYNGWPSQLS